MHNAISSRAHLISNAENYQYPVVKLHGGGVLEDVLQGGGEGEEVIWDPAFPHLGKGVINQAGIQPCYKGPCWRGIIFM